QGQQQAANAAALTNQLLSQQNALLRAQNVLYQVWIQYLIARMTFYRDIERLPLDPRGVWIDEPCSPTAVEPEVLPPPSPVEPAEAGRFADLRPAGGGRGPAAEVPHHLGRNGLRRRTPGGPSRPPSLPQRGGQGSPRPAPATESSPR